MIHYSKEKLVTDGELEFIENLSEITRRIVKNDRSHSAHRLNFMEKEVFLKKILMWVENTMSIKLKSYDYNLYDTYLIIYNQNDFFSKHTDNQYMSKGVTRKFVIGFHLESQYEGGEYSIFIDEKRIDITNETGIVYLFDGDIEHEVKPIRSGIRKSIVIFIDNENIMTGKTEKLI
jgi:predicted 2-oxoglutarate/Fe(II)-dependent dioxygenase YbiX